MAERCDELIPNRCVRALLIDRSASFWQIEPTDWMADNGLTEKQRWWRLKLFDYSLQLESAIFWPLQAMQYNCVALINFPISYNCGYASRSNVHVIEIKSQNEQNKYIRYRSFTARPVCILGRIDNQKVAIHRPGVSPQANCENTETNWHLSNKAITMIINRSIKFSNSNGNSEKERKVIDCHWWRATLQMNGGC